MDSIIESLAFEGSPVRSHTRSVRRHSFKYEQFHQHLKKQFRRRPLVRNLGIFSIVSVGISGYVTFQEQPFQWSTIVILVGFACSLWLLLIIALVLYQNLGHTGNEAGFVESAYTYLADHPHRDYDLIAISKRTTYGVAGAAPRTVIPIIIFSLLGLSATLWQTVPVGGLILLSLSIFGICLTLLAEVERAHIDTVICHAVTQWEGDRTAAAEEHFLQQLILPGHMASLKPKPTRS